MLEAERQKANPRCYSPVGAIIRTAFWLVGLSGHRSDGIRGNLGASLSNVGSYAFLSLHDTPKSTTTQPIFPADPETALREWQMTLGVEAELRGRRSRAGAWERGPGLGPSHEFFFRRSLAHNHAHGPSPNSKRTEGG